VKVLVTRTDRLGDLVLSLPVFAALGQADPDWEVHAMVAPGAVPLVENDPHVARVWTWRDDLTPEEAAALGAELQSAGFDAVVMLQYRRQLAVLLKKAGIARRYGPWSKWASWILLNRGLRQNRSAGGRHEMDFNLQLGERLLQDHGLADAAVRPRGAKLHLSETQVQTSREFRSAIAGVARRIVFVHPGSGGSALDWEPQRFAAVANELATGADCRVFITGAGPDADVVEAVAAQLQTTVTVLLDQYPLRDFLAVLAAGDLLVGPSTGPLHLAAALGVPTLGLFPPVRTMHPDRWGPRGEAQPLARNLVPALECPARRLCREDRCRHYNCMDDIRVDAVVSAAREILERVQN
jgi:ADP-heptose:LPS heptosyltransferase